MRRIERWIVSGFLASTLLSVDPAIAAEPGAGYIGLLAGPNFSSLTNPGIAFGGKAAYRVLPALRAGFFYQHFVDGLNSSSSTSPGTTLTASTTTALYGLEEVGTVGASGHFGMGFRFGLAKANVSFTATDGTNTVQTSNHIDDYFIAPILTYDQFSGKFSFGAELCYFYTFNAATPNLISAVFTAKLWF